MRFKAKRGLGAVPGNELFIAYAYVCRDSGEVRAVSSASLE